MPSQKPGAVPAAPTSAPRTIITSDGERALRDELARLRDEIEVAIAERLKDARSFGGPIGNDDYLQIQEEQAVLAARMSGLEALLATARVIETDAAEGLAVVGTTASVEDLDTGSVVDYRLTGGHEPLAPNAASASSPIGRALMGQRAGAKVEAQLPGGGTRRLRIRAVRAGDPTSSRSPVKAA